jgi:DNA repair protein RecO (recombination protein O)
VSIQNVELIDSCFDAASHPDFLETFSYIADLLTAFAPPHDPSEKLYRMTKACVEAAKSDRNSLAPIRLYFELWLVRLAGYLPDWSKCGSCGRLLSDIETANLQVHHQLFCSGCAKPRGEQIGPREREVFHNVQKVSPSAFADLVRQDTEPVESVSGAMRNIIAKVLGKDSVAWRSSMAAK